MPNYITVFVLYAMGIRELHVFRNGGGWVGYYYSDDDTLAVRVTFPPDAFTRPGIYTPKKGVAVRSANHPSDTVREMAEKAVAGNWLRISGFRPANTASLVIGVRGGRIVAGYAAPLGIILASRGRLGRGDALYVVPGYAQASAYCRATPSLVHDGGVAAGLEVLCPPVSVIKLVSRIPAPDARIIEPASLYCEEGGGGRGQGFCVNVYELGRYVRLLSKTPSSLGLFLVDSILYTGDPPLWELAAPVGPVSSTGLGCRVDEAIADDLVTIAKALRYSMIRASAGNGLAGLVACTRLPFAGPAHELVSSTVPPGAEETRAEELVDAPHPLRQALRLIARRERLAKWRSGGYTYVSSPSFTARYQA